jgi:glutathione synthase/RimK-type ligase-like ATP-grasp enzyme
LKKQHKAKAAGYAVVIDRISQDVPFYRTWLKNAALTGAAVINNPFWWSADDKYFNNCLMTQIGVPVPKTVILPSYELPDRYQTRVVWQTGYPADWEGIFNYVGFSRRT